MKVVDASAVAELLLSTPLAASIRGSLGDATLHAPELLTAEVLSVLRRLLLAGDIDDVTAERALTELVQLGIERYEHEPLLRRALELRSSVTAYDALYVALAEALGAPLVTCDAKLAAAHGHSAMMELIDGAP